MKERLTGMLLVLCGIMALSPSQLHAQDSNTAINQAAEAAQALQNDKAGTKLFRGFGAGIDLLGIGFQALGDHSEYQAYLVANIKGTYFPVVEGGYGKGSKYDDNTFVSYKADGMFGRIGCDYNILNKKTDPYRLTLGLRYGMSKFNYDTTLPTDTTHTVFTTTSEKCTLHWLELVLGVNAKIWGPIHMGWSLRYRRRLKCSEYVYDPQYAPGYGNATSLVQFMGTYTIGIEF